jgi:predicted ester cyclase
MSNELMDESQSVQKRNISVIQQYFDRCWNRGEIDFAETLMIPDYDLHFENGPGGYAAWREGMLWVRQAFSDIHFDIKEMIAERDIVAVRSVWTAKLTGEFMGIKPTGKTFVVKNADFYRLRDGKMVAHWDVSDFLSILCQIGGLPIEEKDVSPYLKRGAWPADAADR